MKLPEVIEEGGKDNQNDNGRKAHAQQARRTTLPTAQPLSQIHCKIDVENAGHGLYHSQSLGKIFISHPLVLLHQGLAERLDGRKTVAHGQATGFEEGEEKGEKGQGHIVVGGDVLKFIVYEFKVYSL